MSGNGIKNFCVKKQCTYIVKYPNRYFAPQTEEFLDGFCGWRNKRQCYYYCYPYRVWKGNKISFDQQPSIG